MLICFIWAHNISKIYSTGVLEMADYKAMYLKMMNAAEEAIEMLIKAQRECEELYMSADEPALLRIDRDK